MTRTSQDPCELDSQVLDLDIDTHTRLIEAARPEKMHAGLARKGRVNNTSYT
jgi:hypothetical protein